MDRSAADSLADRLEAIAAELRALGRDIVVERSKLPREAHLIVDMKTAVVLWKGQRVSLTLGERTLVYLIARYPERVWSRAELMDRMAYGRYSYDRNVDSHMKRIRSKFRELDPEWDAIETVYGLGYKWREPDVAAITRGREELDSPDRRDELPAKVGHRLRQGTSAFSS